MIQEIKSNYSAVPKATFTFIDLNTKRRTVLDSDGNLVSTDIDPEDLELESLEMNDLKKNMNVNAEDLKLRNLVFLSKLIYS